jgi:hypothetical protein
MAFLTYFVRRNNFSHSLSSGLGELAWWLPAAEWRGLGAVM